MPDTARALPLDSPAVGSRPVLVVDDDPSIRLLCRVNLELDGLTVCEAANLSEARAALADEPVSVVLLDVHVGRESGLTLLEELRRDRPDVRVALLTGSAGDEHRHGEADAVIGKPFVLDDLRDTVERLGRNR
jgi:DNA-binding NtrC family response regulator